VTFSSFYVRDEDGTKWQLSPVLPHSMRDNFILPYSTDISIHISTSTHCLLPGPPMCEGHEKKAHFEGVRHLLEPLLSSHNWHIKGIWVDATEEEAKAAWPSHHPALDHLVYMIGPDDPHQVLRGSNKAQTNLLPKFQPDDAHVAAYSLPLQDLELKELHYTSEALLIDFGPAWLQVGAKLLESYISRGSNQEHRSNSSLTSVQLYSKQIWQDSVCKMNTSVSIW